MFGGRPSTEEPGAHQDQIDDSVGGLFSTLTRMEQKIQVRIQQEDFEFDELQKSLSSCPIGSSSFFTLGREQGIFVICVEKLSVLLEKIGLVIYFVNFHKFLCFSKAKFNCG